MAIEKPFEGSPAGGEEIIIRTRLRIAAGGCVLATGLLIGSAGGAVAWADDSEPGGSPAPSQDSDSPNSPAGSVNDSGKSAPRPLRMDLQAPLVGVTNTLRSLQKLANEQQKKASATTDADGVEDGSGLAVAGAGAPASDPDAVAVAQTAADSNAALQANDPSKPVTAQPVTNSVATAANVIVSVPALVASLPTATTPVTDVIASLQQLLTAVTDAVVTQVPTDLVSLLGVPAVSATTTVRGGVTAAAYAPVLGVWASQWADLPSMPFVGNAAVPDMIAPLATVDDIALTHLRHELLVSAIAPPVQSVSNTAAMNSFLEHTVSALLVPASLSALAAVALPGVGGLLIICLAGMRIGYRQAKALMEVRRAGIASFAGPGPLGIVRSGSLIAMRPRGSRVVRRNASLAACRPIEQAA
jgi:hypothetical protein